MITNQDEESEILSTERRTKWLVAISPEDLTENTLENDPVCSIHFHSGKAAPCCGINLIQIGLAPIRRS